MDEQLRPIWYHDPGDTVRYALAVDGKCPADDTPLASEHPQSGLLHCTKCHRVFYREDGQRAEKTWWNGNVWPPNPSKEELRRMLVTMLLAARPHPVEHPTMWKVWGATCRSLGLNPDDYRIGTSNDDLARKREG